MGARFRWLWQKVKKPLEVFCIIIVCILVIVLLVVIALVYIFNVYVPGLRGKTLWDWLQLLIIVICQVKYTICQEKRHAARRFQQMVSATYNG